MTKVLKRNNTKKNKNTNKKINTSRKNTKGGLRINKSNIVSVSPFDTQWELQQGGHRWRKHVRKVMKQHPQEKFGKVLAIAKKTYKKTDGTRKNRKNKIQRGKQSFSSRKNRKSKSIRRKQSGGEHLDCEQLAKEKKYEKDEDEKDEISTCLSFNMFDKDQDGVISWDDLYEAMKEFDEDLREEEQAASTPAEKAAWKKAYSQQITDMINAVGTNANEAPPKGEINYEQFKIMMGK